MEKIVEGEGITIYLNLEDLGKHTGFVYVSPGNVYDIVINNNIEDTLKKEMIDHQCQYIMECLPKCFYSL
jgi:hypothetical protein